VSASDRDSGPNALLQYSCIDGCHVASVDTKDGTIILMEQLDADGNAVTGGNVTHRVTLTVTDGGVPALSATATLLIEGNFAFPPILAI